MKFLNMCTFSYEMPKCLAPVLVQDSTFSPCPSPFQRYSARVKKQ
jgi:hypothetical protein